MSQPCGAAAEGPLPGSAPVLASSDGEPRGHGKSERSGAACSDPPCEAASKVLAAFAGAAERDVGNVRRLVENNKQLTTAKMQLAKQIKKEPSEKRCGVGLPRPCEPL